MTTCRTCTWAWLAKPQLRIRHPRGQGRFYRPPCCSRRSGLGRDAFGRRINQFCKGVQAMTLQQLLGIELPIIQAPMAGVQDHRLAVAVSNAGGLGSLPAAMLSLEALRSELTALQAQTHKPYNVNFFCNTPPSPDATREAAWRAALVPYTPNWVSILH